MNKTGAGTSRRQQFSLRRMFAAVTVIAVAMGVVRVEARISVPFVFSVAFAVAGVYLALGFNKTPVANRTWVQYTARAMVAFSVLLFFLLLSAFCLIGCLPARISRG